MSEHGFKITYFTRDRENADVRITIRLLNEAQSDNVQLHSDTLKQLQNPASPYTAIR